MISPGLRIGEGSRRAGPGCHSLGPDAPNGGDYARLPVSNSVDGSTDAAWFTAGIGETAESALELKHFEGEISPVCGRKRNAERVNAWIR